MNRLCAMIALLTIFVSVGCASTEQIAGLTDERDAARTQRDELRTQLYDEREGANVQLTTVTTELQTARSQTAAVTSQVTFVTNQRDQARIQLTTVTFELQTARSQTAAVTSLVTFVTNERDQARIQFTTVTTERDQARIQLATVTTERDQARQERDQVSQQVVAVTTERDAFRVELGRLQNPPIPTNCDLSSMPPDQIISVVPNLITARQNDIARAREGIRELEQWVGRQTTDAARLQGQIRIGTWFRFMDQKYQEIQALQAQLALVRSTLAAAAAGAAPRTDSAAGRASGENPSADIPAGAPAER